MKIYDRFRLTVDPDFQKLIPPLTPGDYEALETDMVDGGCKTPVIVWNNIVVDGLDKYRICIEWGIPFETKEKFFEGRDEVIAWICAKQLKRQNLTEETRKYLIGRHYDAEKLIRRKNSRLIAAFNLPQNRTTGRASGKEAYHGQSDKNSREKYFTAELIADDYHLSHSTVEKYAVYSRALDNIGKKAPTMQSKILSGQYKISHDNILVLAKMDETSVRLLEERLSAKQSRSTFVSFSISREEINDCFVGTERPALHTEIKNMPAYDPDAEVNGLALTVPTWTGFVMRIREKANLAAVSPEALVRLREVLMGLESSIDSMLRIMEENNYGK